MEAKTVAKPKTVSMVSRFGEAMKVKTVTRFGSLILLVMEAKIDKKTEVKTCDHRLLQLGAASARSRIKTEAGFV
jgi:hypothetical protein